MSRYICLPFRGWMTRQPEVELLQADFQVRMDNVGHISQYAVSGRLRGMTAQVAPRSGSDTTRAVSMWACRTWPDSNSAVNNSL